MAALDFPDTPTVGQLYGSSGTVWRWDGARWASTAGASGARGRVAYAQITAAQGSITGGVDIAGLSVTWTADPTRTYRTTVVGHISIAAIPASYIVYVRDAAAVTQTSVNDYFVTAAGWHSVTGSVVQTGLSGTQTRKVTASTSGTGTFQCSPTTPAFILVEDITYEAGTSGPGVDRAAWGTVASQVNASQFSVPLAVGVAPGMTATWVAKAGRLYRIMYHEPQVLTPSVAGGFVELTIKGTSATGQQQQLVYVQTNSASPITGNAALFAVVGPTASDQSVTYVGCCKASSATGGPILNRSTITPAILLVEDIGPSS